MQQARAFVQHSVTTSYGDSEGTPVAILEASASGLPIVSTEHGGIVDAVLHNETGFLVPECDVDGMAHFMLQLALNPNLAQKLGQAARQHMQSNFSMERTIQLLWQILSTAMAQR